MIKQILEGIDKEFLKTDEEPYKNTWEKVTSRIFVIAFLSTLTVGGITSIVFIGWLFYQGIINILDGNIGGGIFALVSSLTMIVGGIIMYLRMTGRIWKEKE